LSKLEILERIKWIKILYSTIEFHLSLDSLWWQLMSDMLSDPNSLIYLSLVFFTIGTVIQILAMWRARTQRTPEKKQLQTLMSGEDEIKPTFRHNDPIVIDKVDEQTIRTIDKIMKGSY